MLSLVKVYVNNCQVLDILTWWCNLIAGKKECHKNVVSDRKLSIFAGYECALIRFDGANTACCLLTFFYISFVGDYLHMIMCQVSIQNLFVDS